MRDVFAEILSLQPEFSSENTPAMERRGVLVRNELKSCLETASAQLNAALRTEYRGTLSFEGRDGTGRKTYIPWHRVYVEEFAPSAQSGWYVVYLFKADGSGVYLCLGHGSTQFDGMTFNPRSDDEMAALVDFARISLADRIGDNDRIVHAINLANTGSLAKAYEKTTPFAYYYPSEDLPNDDRLLEDLSQFVRLLGFLYAQIELGRVPNSAPPETQAIQSIVSPLRRGGQGRMASAEERRAIELRAMDMAVAYLNALGFSVKDVSGNSSYDLEATSPDQKLFVEVKGTTGSADSILMTANEIEFHRKEYPNTALIIVSGIDLERGEEPSASGGRLDYAQPWQVPEDRLRPTAYEVRLPLGGD